MPKGGVHLSQAGDQPHTLTTRQLTAEADPGYLIRDTLLDQQRPGLKAQDILLAWVIRIPAHLDPAEAARRLLDHYRHLIGSRLSATASELCDLMRTVTAFDRSRLRRTSRPRRPALRNRPGLVPLN